METVIRELLDTSSNPSARWADLRGALKKDSIKVEVQNGELVVVGSFAVDSIATQLNGPCFLLSLEPDAKAVCYIPEATKKKACIEYAHAHVNVSQAFERPHLVDEVLCTTVDEVTRAMIGATYAACHEFHTQNEKRQLIHSDVEIDIGAPKRVAIAPVPVVNVSPTFSSTFQNFAKNPSTAVQIFFDKSLVLDIKEVTIKAWSGTITPNALASHVLQYEKEPCYILLHFKSRWFFILWCPVISEGAPTPTTTESVARMLICVKKASVVLLVQEMLQEAVVQTEAHHPLEISDALASEIISNEKRQIRPANVFLPDRPVAPCHENEAHVRAPPWCRKFS
eukprot:GEMP01049708.1.p1 GENE.GEMP01049708.1~~GEMP01049708.1.p1  ORF type:complete len:339 (-),score=82.83 GEMP01049708.1:556-1572(-)